MSADILTTCIRCGARQELDVNYRGHIYVRRELLCVCDAKPKPKRELPWAPPMTGTCVDCGAPCRENGRRCLECGYEKQRRARHIHGPKVRRGQRA